ncbi:MAG: phosphohydrolase, partial [Psychromonas sp.]|nr:phosphohydrolase [Psychromonas sp.]
VAVRIVATADIFDALTSVRPYKKAWSIEAAFKELKKMAGNKLYSDCVAALIRNKSKVLSIREKFKDTYRD